MVTDTAPGLVVANGAIPYGLPGLVVGRGDLGSTTAEIRYVAVADNPLPAELFPSGDYNANLTVEQADLDLVLLNWGTELADPAGVGWYNDLPSGLIDQEELDTVLLNWGTATNLALIAGTSAIPEPTSITILFCSLCALCVVRLTWSQSTIVPENVRRHL